jgi:hypothetical protein
VHRRHPDDVARAPDGVSHFIAPRFIAPQFIATHVPTPVRAGADRYPSPPRPMPCSARRRPASSVVALLLAAVGGALAAPSPLAAQEPAAWGDPTRDALHFATFSIAAVDPRTGETGVAVTTRVACVGNGVPWVRAGVGAVATQANTRTEYGGVLLDALAAGRAPRRRCASRSPPTAGRRADRWR